MMKTLLATVALLSALLSGCATIPVKFADREAEQATVTACLHDEDGLTCFEMMQFLRAVQAEQQKHRSEM